MMNIIIVLTLNASMWIQFIFCFRKNSGHRICSKCLVHNLSTFQVIRSEHGIQYSNILTAKLLLCWFHLVKVHLIKLMCYQFSFKINFYILWIFVSAKYSYSIRIYRWNRFNVFLLNSIANCLDVINFDWDNQTDATKIALLLWTKKNLLQKGFFPISKTIHRFDCIKHLQFYLQLIKKSNQNYSSPKTNAII